jgi:aspartyl protease family protein
VKHAGIFLILASAAVFGWFAPDLATDKTAAGGASGAEAGAEPKLAVLQQDSWNAGQEVLPRADDGHFYADVTIDGATAHMLVDTGASMVALTDEDAEAMGVPWNEDEVHVVASGANGPVYGVEVTLNQVQLGQLEARNVDAVVIPDGLGISLLGQSFLSKVDRVEMVDDKMVLGG